jgi:glycosyltransferase involved in cell wall biosynthesis
MLRQLSQPRRVLMTVDAVGGVWRYAMDLGSGLAAAGTEIVFVGLGPRPSLAQRDEADRIGKLLWLDLPLDWLATDEAELAAIPDALARVAEEHDVDLLHLNLPSQAAGLRLDRPVLVVAHSCVVTWFAAVRGTDVPAPWAWQRDLNARGLHAADAVLVPSRSHGRAVEASYGSLRRLTVVANATAHHAGTAHKQPVVAAAGRWWDEGKNGATLDRAAGFTDWPVLMAGATRGPNGAACDLRNARALGQLSGPQVRSLIGSAGIVASPSLYEPFGLVALEAASAGAALVLADIPTYRELWSGAALFVPPRDADAWTATINGLAADDAEREMLGARASARARLFNLEAQREAVLAAYAGALAGSPRALRVA